MAKMAIFDRLGCFYSPWNFISFLYIAKSVLLFSCEENSKRALNKCGEKIPHIYGAFIVCSANEKSNADFAPHLKRAI